MAGDRLNKGKPKISMVPTELIEGIAQVMMMGEQKYGRNNWKKGLSFTETFDSLQRHLLAYQKGEYVDQESGLPHLYHAGANLAFLCYFNNDEHYSRYNKFNDFIEDWNIEDSD
jgi:hypothetical protein